MQKTNEAAGYERACGTDAAGDWEELPKKAPPETGLVESTGTRRREEKLDLPIRT